MIAGPTWTTTHVFGECLVNHHKKLMFIKIPKCASSWCDNYLSRLGKIGLDNIWSSGNFQDPALRDYQPMIVLRDPITRWISVTPAGNKVVSIENEDEIVTGLLTKLESHLYDEHLAPQKDFIAGLDISQAVFFQFGSDLSLNFSRFISSRGLGQVESGNFINQGTSNPSKEKWIKLMKRSDFVKEMQRIYRRDYELIQSVKFWSHASMT